MFKQLLSILVTVVLAAGAAGGCVGQDPAGSGAPVDERVPIADAYLDRAHPANAGLLSGLGPDGVPLRDGPTVDPLIIEARRFYDTVQYPLVQPQVVDYPDPFTGGAAGGERMTAPMTFESWKKAFAFEGPDPGEDIQSWRARTGVIVYYNRNELGLGRELGCARFVDDGVSASGGPVTGLACFVANYGPAFNDLASSLPATALGTDRRNTVAITYRPSLGQGYGVQFYAFGANGARLEWAQLDTLGPRPHPLVCMNCHGGTYDRDRHLARGARFLPLDPEWLVFAQSGPYTRAAQEEQIRQFNVMALSTPLTSAQAEYFTAIYGGQPGEPGRAAGAWTPAGWQNTPEDRDLYRQVVRPYCGTCHLAAELGASGLSSPLYRGMGSRAEFAGAPVGAYLCSFQMPNAQPTMNALWRPTGIRIGSALFQSPADALLMFFAGGGRQVCTDLPRMADCRRGPDPDALCGDARSGMSCDAESGQCVKRTAAGPITR